MTIVVGISSIYHVKHVYENGKEIKRNIGFIDKASLENFLK